MSQGRASPILGADERRQSTAGGGLPRRDRSPPREDDALSEILTLIALALLNGVFAGAEIAIIALRKSRLTNLVESGSTRARAVWDLRENPERFLATVQIGVTVISATAAAYGGSTLAGQIEPWIATIPVVERWAHGLSIAAIVALVSYLSLVLGELVPKSLALHASEPYAMWIGKPLLALSSFARPLVWFLTASSNAVLGIFGDRTTFTETRVSSEELQAMVDEAAKTGALHPHAGEIVSRAIDFGELNAGAVMVPRTQVVSLSKNAALEEIKKVLLETGFSRIPVWEEKPDNVVGYISAKDFLALAWEGGLIILHDIVRPAYFVPETMPAADLLKEMQRRRNHLAIIVDEQGALAGIATMEDLIEELVGEIFSEHSGPVPEPVQRQPDGSAIVLATLPVRDVNRELDVELPEGPTWSTVAGLCIALAGHIPQAGERLVTEDGTTLEVVEATPRRVRTVRVVRASAAAAETEGDEEPGSEATTGS